MKWSNLKLNRFHCDNWVWYSNDPSSVHTRRSGPYETSSPGLSLWSNGPCFHWINKGLFSWNQVDTSTWLPGKSFWNASCWNCRIYWSWVKPTSWAKVESPMIFLVVVSNRLVGGSSTGQWSCVEMEKSPRLKGSAMFACVGTRCRIWRRHDLLCHVQCEPMRLFRGAWLPDPLIMACVAASLSHNWMYVEVNSGLINMGVIIAAQASRK